MKNNIICNSLSKSNDLNLYVLFIISIYKGELYH